MTGNASRRVLIAPLDWGLGHATRCIPVIHAFIELGWKPVVAADGRAAALLHEAFPDLEHVLFSGFQVRYPTSGLFAISMLKQGPAFLKSIRDEHIQIEELVKTHDIDLVVSDNRYGCWSALVPSVLITHQLTVKTPVAITDWLTNKTINKAVDQFTACWIPDHEGENSLSGVLSQRFEAPAHSAFIGPLSRFATELPQPDTLWNDLLCEGPFKTTMIVSGPEPMASEFRKKLRDQALHMELEGILITGKPDKEISISQKQGLWEVNHLPAEVLARVLSDTDVVVARSGYSTIMDLAVFGKPALLIPTPGQTEQEYLARRLSSINSIYSNTQRKMWLPDDLEKARKSKGIKTEFNAGLLKRAIQTLE